MNEQIKELFKQTNLHRNDHTTEQRQAEVEKFAVLIVKECAKVARDLVKVENNKLVETVHIYPWDLQFAIEEHFGVDV